MGDGNGAADDQDDVEGVNDLGAGPALGARNDVVGDAVVAAEGRGGEKVNRDRRWTKEPGRSRGGERRRQHRDVE
jgi:hypothetical protein